MKSIHDPLATFLGGYLNQDWDADYDDLEQAVEAYVGDSTPQEIRATLGQIALIVADDLSADDIRLVLRRAGNGYTPDPDARTWLSGLSTMMAKSHLARPGVEDY